MSNGHGGSASPPDPFSTPSSGGQGAGVATKVALRHVCRGARDRLSLEDRARAAAIVAERFPFDLVQGRAVAGYAAIGSELSAWPLLDRLAGLGVPCALPVALAARQPLVFRSWAPGDVLEAGEFKVPTPRPERPEVQPGIVLVPLLGFDRWGHRLGYGAGYYDRTLAALDALGRRPLAIGLAFSLQEVPRVDPEPTDMALDAILTELESISVPGGGIDRAAGGA